MKAAIMTRELTENNYMEALLRAALLLGDLHRPIPVREITISGFLIHNHVRRLYPRCKITARTEHPYYPAEATLPNLPSEDFLILYPLRKSRPS